MTKPKKINPLPENLLSLRNAAKKFDIHPSTLRRWVSMGRVRAYRFGTKKLYVDQAALAALLRPVPARKPGDAA